MRARPIYSNQAQALLELAIFGSILIFCFGILIQYGLSLNYRQALQMATFRKGLDLSFRRSWRGVSDTNVNLVVIKDKSIPDPSDPFRIKSYSPYVSQVNAVYSDKMYWSAAPGDDDKSSFLPGVDYIFSGGTYLEDGQPQTRERHLSSSDFLTKGRGYLVDTSETKDKEPPDEARVGYFTVGWRWGVPCCEEYEKDADDNDIPSQCKTKKTFRRKKINPNAEGVFWSWEEGITCDKVTAGMELDVDDDFVEESVVEVVKLGGEYNPDTSETTPSYIDSLTVSDPKQGDINLAYGEPDRDKKAVKPYYMEDGKEVMQGLQAAYTKTSYIEPKSIYLRRVEAKEGEYNIEGTPTQIKEHILNAEIVNSKETITRKIKLNNAIIRQEINGKKYEWIQKGAPAGTPPVDSEGRKNFEEKTVESEYNQNEGRAYVTEF
jgi:hypothetical protein